MLLLRPKDAEGLGEEEVSQLQNLNSSQSQNRESFHSFPNDLADWMAEVCFGSVVNGDQGKVPRKLIIKALKSLKDKHSQRVLIQYGGINRSSNISLKDKTRR